jgi:hypothetical protein
MNKIIIILLVCVFVVLASVLFLNTKKQPQNIPQPIISAQELSANEYKKLRNDLVEIVIKQNPRLALTTLREKASSNEAIARSCHDLVHEIGHEAYEKYGDFGQAMQYQNDMCNSGYLHGIIESHFAKHRIFSPL